MEVKNIKDVTYVVPDQQDLLKEKLKFAWRRLIFYVFFTFYAFYIVNFPEEVTSLSLLIWTMHILWFELDVSNRRNTTLVQLLHAFSFCGAFVQATLIVMLIAFNPNFIRDVAARENRRYSSLDYRTSRPSKVTIFWNVPNNCFYSAIAFVDCFVQKCQGLKIHFTISLSRC
jgi:hypothetical protein